MSVYIQVVIIFTSFSVGKVISQARPILCHTLYITKSVHTQVAISFRSLVVDTFKNHHSCTLFAVVQYSQWCIVKVRIHSQGSSVCNSK